MSQHHLSPLLKQATGVLAARGEGAYVFDQAGKKYLDFTSGIGVTSTGHCHPKVVEAAQKQVGELIHGQYATVLHPGLLALSDRLAEKMPAGIDTLFYANAGTEAIEAALRLVRQATGRPNIIVFQGGFHGRTMGSLSMTTSSVGLRAGLQPMMGGVVVAPFPSAFRYGWDEAAATDFALQELDHLFVTQSAPRETAAMLIEPVQGESGYVPATMAFMRGLRERCDKHGILLVMDEIQAGFGRSGKFWGHDHFAVRPDIVTTAKGLASGFPLSAFGANEALMEKGWPGSQGGTYGGNAVACAAALATMDVIEQEGLVENAAEQGAYLRKRLEELQSQYPAMADVRGLGLMQGVEMHTAEGKPDGERAGRLLKACEERGLLMLRCGPYQQVVRWLPPLIVSREQVDQAVDIFTEALQATD
ncbi:aspartate aminotransferase family protein [Alkalilimnicola ehrlichii]|uniref:Aspartate aminotransferase family protein n=1 Tax=Alkalilimnicola ehrlichii TaxID=351052 RepID=A0A3E0WR21_9GAMM|nr:aminotransferase class III-fold pyridoxal phosphate-dependent enzyme [Alkalilimnicola ehrlichii]RFA27234.1 aspartate aminotransferase family protein [Alkalilimnicola ehrlichii]RFA35410.1 aspartate aminotransferase family protein [Alkalilimnicola ehrlichii]